ncbi:MAG TPA: ATP-binding protein [Ktedonobacterales bacterium]|nr:ATP-binding protein [Ktedonobacterales bacterium]
MSEPMSDALPPQQASRPMSPSHGGAWARFNARIALRWRLALVLFGLLAVLLLGLGALVSATVETALLTNQAIALHSEVRFALSGPPDGQGRGPDTGAGPLRLAGPGENPLPLGALSAQTEAAGEQLINRLNGPTTDVTLLSTSGDVLAHVNGSPFGAGQGNGIPDGSVPTATLTSAQVRAALTQPQSNQDYVLVTDPSGQRQIVVVLPLSEENQTVAALALGTPTKTIDDSVALVRLILFSGIGVSLALAALLALPLMRAALRPLEEIERTSRKIAAGDLALRLPEPEVDDEIGRLARAFNVMVGRLEGMLTRQRRFMADVSHELRTPLTAVTGGIEMLLLGAHQADPASGARLLRGMYGESERMGRLVEELLTLARLDEGRLTFQFAAVDAAALIATLCDEAQPLVRDQTLQCEADPGLPPVRADADRLKQVLLILLDNALKFTPAGGEVTVRAQRMAGDQFATFEVADTGIGISPEDTPHVFERFYRVDPARARSQQRAGGSGLGLAIAQSLVEAQGGAISLISALGAGTTVTVRLPLWQGVPPLAATPAP